MFDFLKINVESKKGYVAITPDFYSIKSKDLMIRGKDFYAIWDEENATWSTSEDRAKELIDKELYSYSKIISEQMGVAVTVNDTRTTSSPGADRWYKFIRKLSSDNYKSLNSNVIFKSQEAKREDYTNVRLDYDLEEGEPECYNALFNVIFSEEELEKLEWAIGSIFCGDSKRIQKFIVMYGEPGTGKSTYLEYIIQALFKGYYTNFIAKDLANSNNQFALEPFKNNPLVAIQSDGDLSRIFDNTLLNSLVSHEEMMVNEKHKNMYSMKFNSFLFMGTNYPVDISSSKSGIIRRLIVVQPTGNKVKGKLYFDLVDGLKFEKGKIANKCIETYKRLGMHYYDSYIPEEMQYETDDFYNFIEEDYYNNLKTLQYVQGNVIWKRYKQYCEDNNVRYILSYSRFRTELKGYFNYFYKYKNINGAFCRNVYEGFRKDKIGIETVVEKNGGDIVSTWISLDSEQSIFDEVMKGCLAQYANENGTPMYKWDKCLLYLGKIDTKKLHYVKVPENHIVIDFDLKDEEGNKNLTLNIEAASKFPKTYVEVSKGGQGLHLHYIYDGDVDALASIYSIGIEIKVFKGGASLRRKLTKCNDIPIAHIGGGLPLKEKKSMLNYEGFKSEKSLRKFIKDCLDKKHHGATKPEVDFIFKKLEETYDEGISYDVRDLRQKIYLFCIGSSNQSDACVKMFNQMHFCSKEYEINEIGAAGKDTETPIIFLDVEVLPNLFLICWKYEGEDAKVVRMYNPKPEEVEALFNYRIIGFNNRRYDNHMLYAASMGYSPKQIFNLSQRIIVDNDRSAFFGEAYNLSYTDIYDFAAKKQGLKKWEIELGINHKELDMPWDQPAEEELWGIIGDYCENDVIATEAVFNNKDIQADFVAREILADISGLSVNDTTNQHTIRIIIGEDKKPQSKFIYTNLATGERSDGTVDSVKFPGYIFSETGLDKDLYPKDEKGKPIFTTGKSLYKGIDPSEGGYAKGWPGVYFRVGLYDIKSMHPTSGENLKIFGPYTENFSNIKKARILIKEGKLDECKKMFDGKLIPYLDDPAKLKQLAYALKIAINSVYGLTSASFDNKLRDPRNKDNIVAKRGALFMIDLIEEVTRRGYKVIHVKTDSIKVANADAYISKFISEFGKMYGYDFDHEAYYDRICLVNDAVYIAKYASKAECEEVFGYIPGDNYEEEGKWNAKGKEFQVPYIFKSLFSHEEYDIKDFSVINSVSTAMYIDIAHDDNPNNYIFVGRVGEFTPMKVGHGGGNLLVKRVDKFGNVKYDNVSGCKGYEWMETSDVLANNLVDDIDYSYFERMADDAKKHISDYMAYEDFITDAEVSFMYKPVSEEEEVPF